MPKQSVHISGLAGPAGAGRVMVAGGWDGRDRSGAMSPEPAGAHQVLLVSEGKAGPCQAAEQGGERGPCAVAAS